MFKFLLIAPVGYAASEPSEYGNPIIVSPEGKVLHQAGRGEELMRVNVDFELVRRVRESGSLGLGQPLKSFRDANLRYPVYDGNCSAMPGFSNLGLLELNNKPSRKTNINKSACFWRKTWFGN